MFDPWYESSAIDVGPINENNELSLDVRTFMKYVSAVKSQKKTSKIFSSDSMCELMVKNTRFNYFDGNNCIGIACGDYASSLILQNIERFVIHPDVGFRVQTTNIVEKLTNNSNDLSKLRDSVLEDKQDDTTESRSYISEVCMYESTLYNSNRSVFMFFFITPSTRPSIITLSLLFYRFITAYISCGASVKFH